MQTSEFYLSSRLPSLKQGKKEVLAIVHLRLIALAIGQSLDLLSIFLFC